MSDDLISRWLTLLRDPKYSKATGDTMRAGETSFAAVGLLAHAVDPDAWTFEDGVWCWGGNLSEVLAQKGVSMRLIRAAQHRNDFTAMTLKEIADMLERSMTFTRIVLDDGTVL
jgi:hypothetical protein